MERWSGEDGPQGRLDERMALLDARSRVVMELWLAGRSRREIAADLRVSEEVVAAITGAAFHRLRGLLACH